MTYTATRHICLFHTIFSPFNKSLPMLLWYKAVCDSRLTGLVQDKTHRKEDSEWRKLSSSGYNVLPLVKSIISVCGSRGKKGNGSYFLMWSCATTFCLNGYVMWNQQRDLQEVVQQLLLWAFVHRCIDVGLRIPHTHGITLDLTQGCQTHFRSGATYSPMWSEVGKTSKIIA